MDLKEKKFISRLFEIYFELSNNCYLDLGRKNLDKDKMIELSKVMTSITFAIQNLLNYEEMSKKDIIHALEYLLLQIKSEIKYIEKYKENEFFFIIVKIDRLEKQAKGTLRVLTTFTF